MTEYGLAPINSDPSFTVAATPGAVGSSRWLAPEIITPVRKGSNMPVMESKAADVFAFGMFAVEVFTGKIPFEEQKNEAVVLRISRGGRPEMPENSQMVGLTAEMWKLLESCWQQNPKRRPTMEEVVRRWEKFVGDNGDRNGVIECVQITLAIRISSSVPFSTSAIDLGAHHLRQDSHRDNGRRLRPFNLHRGLRPADPERSPSLLHPERSLKPFGSERLLRQFDQQRCLRSSSREGDLSLFSRVQSLRLFSRVQSTRLFSRIQSPRLLDREHRS